MQLTLRDIGKERFLSLIGRRFQTLQAQANGRYYGQNPSPPLANSKRFNKAPRRLARYWTKPLNLTDEESNALADQIWQGNYGMSLRAFAVVFAVQMMIPLALLNSGRGQEPGLFLLFFFTILWGSIITAMLAGPRMQFKQADSRPLTVEEVESLMPSARGRLERQYFALVIDALRTEVPSESAQSDIRAALRYLGDAITRLPGDPVATTDADVIRREAQTLRQQAARESDAFVEASLQRQADMLEQRATLTAQNGRAARRAAALRREAKMQMDSLRSILVGFQQTPQLDVANVSHLSAALQRVATEAKSVALARQELENEELERLYGGAVPKPEAIAVPTPQVVAQVGNGAATTTPPTPPPPPTTGGRSGPWWRNNS